jgi:hypothetical protein
MKVTVLSNMEDSGNVKAVPKGALDIGLSSRPLTEEEGKRDVGAVEYTRSASRLGLNPLELFRKPFQETAAVLSFLFRLVKRPIGLLNQFFCCGPVIGVKGHP